MWVVADTLPQEVDVSIASDLSKIFNQETHLSFQEISYLIASKFIDKELSDNELHNIIESCITFDAPNRCVYDDIYCLELFHGPTLAFKDVGAKFLALCMDKIKNDFKSKGITVLVATSGDTGGAVAKGFEGRWGIFCLEVVFCRFLVLLQ